MVVVVVLVLVLVVIAVGQELYWRVDKSGNGNGVTRAGLLEILRGEARPGAPRSPLCLLRPSVSLIVTHSDRVSVSLTLSFRRIKDAATAHNLPPSKDGWFT